LETFTFSPIGYVRSPYKQKFAIPRQPGLVKSASGFIEFVAPYNNPDAVRGLEEFSHLWVQFVFHETAAKGWKPVVRPPRLGGNTGKGVFATRTTFRPNPIGLSVVEISDVKPGRITVIGLDLLDGTPILDIKPYLPYSDAHPDATGAYADARPDTGMQVEFSSQALDTLEQVKHDYPGLKTFITEVLAQDPRPGYHLETNPQRTYGMHLYTFNIQWCVDEQGCKVINIS